MPSPVLCFQKGKSIFDLMRKFELKETPRACPRSTHGFAPRATSSCPQQDGVRGSGTEEAKPTLRDGAVCSRCWRQQGQPCAVATGSTSGEPGRTHRKGSEVPSLVSLLLSHVFAFPLHSAELHLPKNTKNHAREGPSSYHLRNASHKYM